MTWLNYHHLLYFWSVAREGSVSRAAQKLRLAQPTISTQIKRLEDALGEQLFERQGRSLVLTEVGRLVFRHADEIFAIGYALQESLRGRPAGRALRFVVGISTAVSTLMAHSLLGAVVAAIEPLYLACRQGHHDDLVGELASHRLDVVIADAPASPSRRVRVFSHPLMETGVSFMARRAQAARLRRTFPASLDRAPMLLPSGTSARLALERWFESAKLQPNVVAEFEDTSLMKAFGATGGTVFPVPTAIERDVRRRYGVSVVGRTAAVRERYYALSAERTIKHPAVVALTSVPARVDAGITEA
ncbi:MAG: transcriptional activator NhaR [Acidobacteriota bacterium]